MSYSQDPEIEAASLLVVAALQEFYEQGDKSTKNPYEGMSYVASVVLKNPRVWMLGCGSKALFGSGCEARLGFPLSVLEVSGPP